VLSLIEQDCIPGGTRDNLKTANAITEWGKLGRTGKVLLTDAQTSGGLLLCVKPKHLATVRRILKSHRCASAAVIGRIVRGPVGHLRITQDRAGLR